MSEAERTGTLTFSPHPLSIVLRRFFLLVILAAIAVAIPRLLAVASFPAVAPLYPWTPFLAVFAWEILVWASRRYSVGDGVYESREGVLQRLVTRIEPSRVQQVTVTKLVRERIFGLGSVVISSASDSVPTVRWAMIARPEQRAALVRSSSPKGQGPARSAPHQDRPFVLGIAGGIGSGKSAFARALARHGARVIDSDAEARKAIERPDVVARLREWWGEEVVGPDGKPDRKKIASIVFDQPEQRRRLESLVHPIIKAEREAFISRAARDGVRVVVVDAPLLFEAGVNKECDATVFVDCPREIRLARVKDARGWSDEEFARRESAQMPLDQKRAASQFVVINSGGEQELDEQVESLLKKTVRSPDWGRDASQ